MRSCPRGASGAGAQAPCGVFLRVSDGKVLLLRGKRAAVWEGLYLDAHGEETKGARRQLSRARYEALGALWAGHGVGPEVVRRRGKARSLYIENVL